MQKMAMPSLYPPTLKHWIQTACGRQTGHTNPSAEGPTRKTTSMASEVCDWRCCSVFVLLGPYTKTSLQAWLELTCCLVRLPTLSVRPLWLCILQDRCQTKRCSHTSLALVTWLDNLQWSIHEEMIGSSTCA